MLSGINAEKLAFIMELKNVKTRKNYTNTQLRNILQLTYFIKEKRPWSVSCDIALPCATQNELNGDEAKTLIS